MSQSKDTALSLATWQNQTEVGPNNLPCKLRLLTSSAWLCIAQCCLALMKSGADIVHVDSVNAMWRMFLVLARDGWTHPFCACAQYGDTLLLDAAKHGEKLALFSLNPFCLPIVLSRLPSDDCFCAGCPGNVRVMRELIERKSDVNHQNKARALISLLCWLLDCRMVSSSLKSALLRCPGR